MSAPAASRAAWLMAALTVLVLGVLATTAPVMVPDVARLVLVFVALVLLPGAGLVRLFAPPPGGGALALGWAFGAGVAYLSLQVALVNAAGGSFLRLAVWTPVTSALPWVAAALWPPRDPASRHETPLARGALVAFALAAAYALFHAARFGPPAGLSTDTPDHVGTLRRMLETGALFPEDAFFKDAGRLGADPRKGLWHGVVALIARIARLDPHEVWRGLPALIVPCFVANAAALGALVRGNAGAAVAAWALVLTYGSGLTRSPLRQAVFASRVGDQLALAAAVALLADLRAPSARRRAMLALLAFAAVAAHVFAFIQFAMLFGALAVGLLIRDRGWSPAVRRLVADSALVVAVCAPYLAWRALQSYAPGNPIHTEPQGLLELFPGWTVVSIGQLWEWMGYGWLLVPLSWPLLWRARANAAVLYLLTSSLAVALVMYDPLAVKVLEPRVGYLLMRMIWLVPFAGLLAWLLPELVARARGAASRGARLGAALGLALAALLLWPQVSDGVRVIREPRLAEALENQQEYDRWSDALDWMRANLPRGTVVLSDPATSYAIPMGTGLYVATLVDQHSSPNDTLALRRILDARDGLDPWGDWGTLREVVRRHRVDVIVLNDRFVVTPILDYWSPGSRWYAAARARLDAHPAVFERVFDVDRFTVYRLDRAALDTLSAPIPPRAFLAPSPAGARLVPMGPGMPSLAGFALDRAAAAPGDSVAGVVEWSMASPTPAPPGSYMVAVRFDTPMPGGERWPAAIRKPVRKVVEKLRRQRFRFRDDHPPVGGQFGVDRWRPGVVVRDSFALRIPSDVADGDYRVEVRLHRQPHFANLRLIDYFSDDDYLTGVPVGTLTIRRAPPGAPAP